MRSHGEANSCAMTAKTGLKVRCEVDASRYAEGIKVAGAEVDAPAIQRGPFHAG
jgi:hypothetical protein